MIPGVIFFDNRRGTEEETNYENSQILIAGPSVWLFRSIHAWLDWFNLRSTSPHQVSATSAGAGANQNASLGETVWQSGYPTKVFTRRREWRCVPRKRIWHT